MSLDWISKRLTSVGRSQADLARALKVDPAAISRLLKGKRKIQSAEIPELCRVLEVSPESLFAEIGRPPPLEPHRRSPPGPGGEWPRPAPKLNGTNGPPSNAGPAPPGRADAERHARDQRQRARSNPHAKIPLFRGPRSRSVNEPSTSPRCHGRRRA